MNGVLLSACDRAMAEAPCAMRVHAGDRPRLILATTILASSLAFIDGSVVNVGLPAIGRSLGADGAGLTWIVNGYLLPLSALLLLGGAAGDRFGRRRVLMLGVAMFALASLLCAAAPNVAALVAGRMLQGCGAALPMPNSLAIIGASFEGAARGRAIGTWAAVGAAAGAIGPLAGGEPIDLVGWRSIFPDQLAAGGAGPVAGRARPARRAGRGCQRARPGRRGAGEHRARLPDLGPDGRIDGAAALALGIGAAMLALFLRVERKAGAAAMLPLALFGARFRRAQPADVPAVRRARRAAGGAALRADRGRWLFGSAAGAALLPLPVVIALASPAVGRVAMKTGPRLPLTVAPAVVAAGFFLATRIGGGAYWSTTPPALLAIAAGMAGAVAPLTAAVLGAVDARHTGIASGIQQRGGARRRLDRHGACWDCCCRRTARRCWPRSTSPPSLPQRRRWQRRRAHSSGSIQPGVDHEQR